MGNPATVVMIVEPDEAFAKELAGWARAMKGEVQVYFAKDGYEAKFKLRNVVPQVLVTDLSLHPAYSGRKLIEESLAESRLQGMSVIVTTEASHEEFCVDQVATGQVLFLCRPFQQETFHRALARALGRAVADAPDFRLRALDPGERLFCEGEPADHAYILKSGTLRVIKEAVSGPPLILGEVVPGEFVGEMAYINGEPRSATVEAIVASELIEIPLHSLDTIVFAKPAWSKALLKTLSKRLKGANAKKAA